MKVTVQINENLIDRLYSSYCDNRDCSDCSSQIMINDKFDSCKEKYLANQLESDIQKILDRI